MLRLKGTEASHLEMETAWAVLVGAGNSVSDEEEDLLPDGASEAVYVQVLSHTHHQRHGWHKSQGSSEPA